MMASSWNLLAGYTGQVSFAHAAFAGVGAYVSGLAAIHFHLPPLLGALLGMAVAALLGLLLGVLCIRMGGIYLSLTTLAFSEMLRIIIDNEYEFTRGTMGLSVPFILPVYSKTAAYFLMGVATLAVLFAIRAIVRSDLGTAFRAVQNDETAAASLGIHVVKVRLAAFVISGTMAGLAGALYGHYHQLITPEILSLNLMFFVLAMTVIGGMGTFVGPIVGAVFLEFLSEYIRIYGQFHVLLFGLIALVVCRFAPQGLMGLWQRRMRAVSS
uniref:Branched-chain amino acid ABC transporter permease n=1 Tax=Desulfacinum infernum TaxID=35837 RepID=A0A832A7X5_9BACT